MKKIRNRICSLLLVLIMLFQGPLNTLVFAEGSPAVETTTQQESISTEMRSTEKEEDISTEHKKEISTTQKEELSTEIKKEEKIKDEEREREVPSATTEEKKSSDDSNIQISGIRNDVITEKRILSPEEARGISVPVPDGKEICSILDIYQIEANSKIEIVNIDITKSYTVPLEQEEEYSIVHFSANNKAQILPAKINVDKDTITNIQFKSTSFSYFALCVLKDKAKEETKQEKNDTAKEKTELNSAKEKNKAVDTDGPQEDGGEAENKTAEEKENKREDIAKTVSQLDSGEYVSRTPNIDIDGTKLRDYSHNQSFTNF